MAHLSDDEIEERFGHTAASIEGPNPNEELHAEIRLQFKKLAKILNYYLPDGRGKSVMFTELETASMWAHKSLAGRSGDEVPNVSGRTEGRWGIEHPVTKEITEALPNESVYDVRGRANAYGGRVVEIDG